MQRLIPINRREDIPAQFRGTPVERLLGYHNLGDELTPVPYAEILIGMCMDNRKVLRTPENFAFVLRSGGANLRSLEFTVSYAIGVGGVRAIAHVVHTHCGMVGVSQRRQAFIDGLVEVGWDAEAAVQHFMSFAPLFEIGNEIDFALVEAKRLRYRYPKVIVAPMLYKVEDNRLYCIQE